MDAPEQRLRQELAGIAALDEHPSQFAPRDAWWTLGTEVAHIERGVVDIRLTRKAISSRRRALKENDDVELRSGDWLSVRLKDSTVDLIVELIREAIETNASRRPGTPDDEGLVRRRRLHGSSTEDLAP
jgi:hypothetical protein